LTRVEVCGGAWRAAAGHTWRADEDAAIAARAVAVGGVLHRGASAHVGGDDSDMDVGQTRRQALEHVNEDREVGHQVGLLVGHRPRVVDLEHEVDVIDEFLLEEALGLSGRAWNRYRHRMIVAGPQREQPDEPDRKAGNRRKRHCRSSYPRTTMSKPKAMSGRLPTPLK